MLSCRLCHYRCINSLVSLHCPPTPLLRRSYATTTTAPISSSHNPNPPPPLSRTHRKSSRLPPPSQFSIKKRSLLDQIALKDPAKLADTVRRRLHRGERDVALNLTREASRTMNSVVSWNHVIKHHLDHGEIKRAFQTFNEMKKRGISPDSHTFTLILNGLANYAHFGQSVSRAIQLYNSLSAPKSPVAPNIYHTNAVLKVCVRADDLDSVWNIIGNLPAKGPNAPNTLTYTILLNGICSTRDGTINVEDGRRVWAGVLSRWNKGQIWIDEDLTCSMGRVLLKGEREGDWNEVFTLCEQIFGVESLVPQRPPKQVTKDSIFAEGTDNLLSKTSPEDTKTINAPKPLDPSTRAISTPKAFDSNTEVIFTPKFLDQNTKTTPAPKPLDPSTETAFTPVVTTHSSSTRPIPGNPTLSLILQACAAVRNAGLAFKYWERLTNGPYYVKPDLENYHDKLRVLRISRLGTEALKVVEAMRVTPTPKTFYIAMSSCKRHGRSNAFNAAEGLLDLMIQKHGLQVDVKVWNMFLQCALKTGEASYVKRALRRIDEVFDMETEMVRRRSKPLYVERALELVRSMVGAVEILMLEGAKYKVTWGHGEREAFEKRRKGLAGLVTRYGAGAKRRAYKIEMEGDDYE